MELYWYKNSEKAGSRWRFPVFNVFIDRSVNRYSDVILCRFAAY